MLRTAVAAALAAILLAAEGPALAAGAPDAAQIRQAAEQFDAGVAAYKQKDFEGAASRFEAADAAVPSAQALRQAIRARSEARQPSRAATLAAQAVDRYPGDGQTQRLAREILEKNGPKLHKLTVRCASPCVLAIGTRSVPGESSVRWTVYLDPGKAALSASFGSGKSGLPKDIEARAGGATEVRFEPEPEPEPPRLKPPDPPPPSGKPLDQPLPPKDLPPSEEAPPRSSGLPPAVFFAGLVVTAGLGAGIIGSGIDTLNNPGRDAVRKACMGKNEKTCPLYEKGVQHETRTNILIGATAGAAAITAALGLFFTDWGGKKTKAKGSPLVPAATVTDHGATIGAIGQF
jgi:hypothetical protein